MKNYKFLKIKKDRLYLHLIKIYLKNNISKKYFNKSILEYSKMSDKDLIFDYQMLICDNRVYNTIKKLRKSKYNYNRKYLFTSIEKINQ